MKCNWTLVQIQSSKYWGLKVIDTAYWCVWVFFKSLHFSWYSGYIGRYDSSLLRYLLLFFFLLFIFSVTIFIKGNKENLALLWSLLISSKKCEGHNHWMREDQIYASVFSFFSLSNLVAIFVIFIRFLFILLIAFLFHTPSIRMCISLVIFIWMLYIP